MATESTDLARVAPSSELVSNRLQGGLAEGNGVIDPARWQMLAAIAETVYGTEFVPAGLRGKKPATLACLLYGDSLGLHPMAALKEVHVIDGTPGLSAAAMAALVRKAHPGHRLKREEIRDAEGRFLGVTITGTRGDTEETDSYTFTLDMATRAGLMSKHNWKAYPEAMCSARATSQICTFLFPDVFMGSPLMPEELEGHGIHETHDFVDAGHVVVKPPALPAEAEIAVEQGTPLPETQAAAAAEAVAVGITVDETGAVVRETAGEHAEQQEWEVADADSQECVTYIDAATREQLRGAPADAVVRLEGADYEIVGFEVDGATQVEKLLVRVKPAPAGKPEAGSAEAVVRENIPEILGKWVAEAQQAGNIEFVRGVLNAEREGKNRGRLVTTLEEIVAKMEADEVAATVAGDGTGADNPLLEESESAEDAPLEGEHEEPTADAVAARAMGEAFAEPEPGAFVPIAPDPEPVPAPPADIEEDVVRAADAEIPYGTLSKKAKEIRLAAFCAVVEDQFPTERAWHRSGVLGAASRQWGITAHALSDLDEEQLEAIWNAASQYVPEAVDVLKLVSPAGMAQLPGVTA